MTNHWQVSNCLIKPLTQVQRDQMNARMALLQETERALSSDRAPGSAMAHGHVDYLLATTRACRGAF